MLKMSAKQLKTTVLFTVMAIGLGFNVSNALAASGVKAAYVETVSPSKPFSGTVQVLNSAAAVGPGTGILGVTSITLTNFDSSAQQVFVFAPVFSNSTTCSGSIIGGGTPQMTVYVQPFSTLHLTYPSPLVFSSATGTACVAVEVTTTLHGGGVEMIVNGFIN
ncbi:hypothetical protein [Methylomonas sp. AM2-LC]|uniref:hypothetical protein n=1 Tax=Methylomonas sp. AM2-LC TaxID=3153301 RepID=UPI0032653112